MTDPGLIEFAVNTADTYFMSASAMAWQITQGLFAILRKPGPMLNDPSDFDKTDNEIYEFLSDWLQYPYSSNDPSIHNGWMDLFMNYYKCMETGRLLWRATSVLLEWIEIAQNEELSIDSMPSPRILLS